MKNIVFIFLLFHFHQISAQNLVPNPSFEDTVKCPSGSGAIKDAKGWFQPNNDGSGNDISSTDYFNVCAPSSSGLSIPNNWGGFQNPRTGVAYAAFAGFLFYPPNYDNNGREYLEVQLTNPLLSGKKYIVKFYVSFSEKSQYAIDALGAYFSNNMVIYNSPGFSALMQYTPQIQNIKGNVITDTTNWILISDTLLAQGGEQYMTIGNFKADTATVIDTLAGNKSSNAAYYYIDDVSVELDTTTSIGELDAIKNSIKVFPNPVRDKITIVVHFPEKSRGMVELFDIMGVKIGSYALKEGNNQLDVITNEFSSGIYIYKVMFGGVLVQDGKIVILK